MIQILALSLSLIPRYYMVVYGVQTTPNYIHTSHTYAVFVKVTGDRMEAQTISWMPKSMKIESTPIPESGINLDLKRTHLWVDSVKAKTITRGPYRITKNLYEMAQKQKEVLESGKVKYVCLDRLHRGNGATNCAHAVCDLDITQPLLETGTTRGRLASLLVVRHLRKHIVDTNENMGWLLTRLEH